MKLMLVKEKIAQIKDRQSKERTGLLPKSSMVDAAKDVSTKV